MIPLFLKKNRGGIYGEKIKLFKINNYNFIIYNYLIYFTSIQDSKIRKSPN